MIFDGAGMGRRRVRAIAQVVAAVMLAGCGGVEAAGVHEFTALELAVVEELNLVRADPKGYAKKYLKGSKGAAAKECYEELLKTKAVPLLTASVGMSLAAMELVRDQEKNGKVSHNTSDGATPFERMERYGSWKSGAGENVSYGMDTARAIVLQLLIDKGVPSRGHRKNIMNPLFRVVGVAAGGHKIYSHMFVMDFAGGFEDK
jgi:hypothetical protein